ncbi:hypothetical protein BMETH_25592993732374, partial [methanotrophic bacterial endosymbiont of Bathymodiolus sp.]
PKSFIGNLCLTNEIPAKSMQDGEL